MSTAGAAKVRGDFADTINRVKYTGERVVIRRRGKPVAAVVSMEDLELLEAMEDRIDVEAARKALREKGTLSLAQVRTALGLK